MWNDEYHMRGMEKGIEEGAAREREKWEAENEALRQELARIQGEWPNGIVD
jgi:hypothetical protein